MHGRFKIFGTQEHWDDLASIHVDDCIYSKHNFHQCILRLPSSKTVNWECGELSSFLSVFHSGNVELKLSRCSGGFGAGCSAHLLLCCFASTAVPPLTLSRTLCMCVCPQHNSLPAYTHACPCTPVHCHIWAPKNNPELSSELSVLSDLSAVFPLGWDVI